MSRNFQRRREDFTCESCGAAVTGDGYTNHCPVCLWSKHVDINPGDRAQSCQGMMEPAAVETKQGTYRIRFVCSRCGEERWNKASKTDDFEMLTQIAANRWGAERN